MTSGSCQRGEHVLAHPQRGLGEVRAAAARLADIVEPHIIGARRARATTSATHTHPVRRRPHDQLIIARRAQPPQQGVERIARHGELRAAGHPHRTRREDGRQLVSSTPRGMLGELAQRLGLVDGTAPADTATERGSDRMRL